MHNEIIPEVERLIHVCRDGEELFRHAATVATSAHLKSLFQEYADQRKSFLAELQTEAVAFGEKHPTDSGTVGGAVQRGWAKLRESVSTPDEHTLLSECESEEDDALEAYRAAVEITTLPETLRNVVARQYAEVTAAHRNIRDLRDASKPKA
jgi:uncharacterized protein (TIGR02284 family)